MILFRVRRYGSSDWYEVSVRNTTEDDDDSQIEKELSELLESVLVVDDLHTQRLNDDGKWEDLE